MYTYAHVLMALTPNCAQHSKIIITVHKTITINTVREMNGRICIIIIITDYMTIIIIALCTYIISIMVGT